MNIIFIWVFDNKISYLQFTLKILHLEHQVMFNGTLVFAVFFFDGCDQFIIWKPILEKKISNLLCNKLYFAVLFRFSYSTLNLQEDRCKSAILDS